MSNPPPLPPSIQASIEGTHADTVRAFETHKTRPYEWRLAQMRGLKAMVMERQEEMITAMMKDLGRPRAECDLGEMSGLKISFDTFFAELKGWMSPDPRPIWGLLAPGKGEVRPEPMGSVLIIAPFNFPFLLTLKPLMGCIAAGCCAVVKPSELVPACSALLAKHLPSYLDPSCFRVVQGGAAETASLLQLRWDKIVFTGSTRVGKVVAAAAARHLTPCLLECGGKNAAFVDDKVQSMAVIGRRLVWGRTFNCGQTCLAPDYVLCMESSLQPLLDALLKAVEDAFGDDPSKSPDLSRVINSAAATRLKGVIEGTSGTVVCGGRVEVGERYVSPTIIVNPKLTDQVMVEESFGPVLCIITVSSVDDAVSKHNKVSGKHPLAFYPFSSNRRVIEELLTRVRSGGVSVNDVICHAGMRNMPFGGLGDSGMGCYFGQYSFEAFSHRRGVFHKWLNYDNELCDPSLRYAPSTPTKVMVLQIGTMIPDLPPLPSLSPKSVILLAGTVLALWYLRQ